MIARVILPGLSPANAVVASIGNATAELQAQRTPLTIELAADAVDERNRRSETRRAAECRPSSFRAIVVIARASSIPRATYASSHDRRTVKTKNFASHFRGSTASPTRHSEKKCWRNGLHSFYLRFRSGTLQPTNHFGGATMPGPKKPARKATKRRKTTKRAAVKSPAKKAAKKRSAKKGGAKKGARKAAKKRAPARKTAAKRSGAKKAGARKTARKAGRKGAKKGAKRASKR